MEIISPEEYIKFLKELPRNEQIRTLDPNWISPQLTAATVITQEEKEFIQQTQGISGRQIKLFSEILPNKDSKLVISQLYKTASENGYVALSKAIQDRWGNCQFWKEVGLPAPFPFSVVTDYLKNWYKTDAEAMQRQWEKLLFQNTNKFQFENMFVNVEIVDEGSWENQKVQSYSEVFGETQQARQKRKKIVLEGDAGMGKSTYMHKIAYDWAIGDRWLNDQFELVILIRLGDLMENQTFEEVLAEQVPDSSVIFQFMSNLENHDKILFVLDAYDEFYNKNTCKQISAFVNESKLKLSCGTFIRNATLIVSSRIPQSQEIHNKDVLIRTVGFEQGVVLRNFKNKIGNLESALQQRNQKELCKNPLFLGFSAALGYIVEELYALMDSFCRMVLERHLKTKPLGKSTSGDFQDIWNQITTFLSKFAFVTFKSPTFFHDFEMRRNSMYNSIKNLFYVFQKKEAWDIFNYDAADLIAEDQTTFEICCELGLLWVQKAQPVCLAQFNKSNLPFFPHQIFSEFFAAMFVSKNPELIRALDKKVNWNPGDTYQAFSYFLSVVSQEYKEIVLKRNISREWFDCPWIYEPQTIPDIFIKHFQNFLLKDDPRIYGESNAETSVLLNAMAKKLMRNNYKVLHLWKIIINSDSMLFLKHFSGAETVQFWQCQIGDDETRNEFNEWISNHPTCRQLVLYQCSRLANSMTFDHLLSLSFLIFDGCSLTEKTLDSLTNLMKNPECKIQELHVGENELQTQSSNFIKALPISLKTLHLGCNNLSKHSIIDFMQYIEKAEELTVLRFCGNGMLGSEQKLTESLAKLPLEELHMCTSHMTNEFIKLFAEYTEGNGKLMVIEPVGSVDQNRHIAALASRKGNNLEPPLPSFKTAVDYLKLVYKRDSETMQRQWSQLLDHAKEFKFDNMYINPEIIDEGIHKKQKIQGYADIFGEIEEVGGKKIVLVGDPGMGKSTYMHKIAYDWANGHEWLNDAFNLVILVRLGELKQNKTFWDFMSELVTEQNASAILQFMSDAGNHHKILFILDAYDDFSNKSTCVDISTLLDEFKLGSRVVRNSTLIVSSRIPHFKEIKNVDVLLRITGLEENVVLENFGNKIKNLEKAMENKYQKGLFRNPLVLGFGAALGYIPGELYDFINGFYRMVVERYLKVKHIELQGTTPKELWDKITAFMSKFAFVVLKPDLYFTNQKPIPEVQSIFSLDPVLLIQEHFEIFTLCFQIGLLWQQKDQPTYFGSVTIMNLPYFPHKIFREFFAAIYVNTHADLIIVLEKKPDWKPEQTAEPFSYFLSVCLEYKKILLQNNIDGSHFYTGRSWIYKPQDIPDNFISSFEEFLLSHWPQIKGNKTTSDGLLLSGLGTKLAKLNYKFLTLDNIIVDSNTMIFIPLFGAAENISFSKCDIETDTQKQFQTWISSCTACRCLNLDKCDSKLGNSVKLSGFISLRELRFLVSGLTEATINSMIELLKNPSLKLNVLEVHWNKGIGESSVFIRSLPLTLTKLNIEWCDLSRQSVTDLMEYIEQAKGLKHLNVNGNEMVGCEPRFAQSISKSALQQVWLYNIWLRNDFLENFLKYNKDNTTLQHLHINDTTIEYCKPDLVKSLKNMKHCQVIVEDPYKRLLVLPIL